MFDKCGTKSPPKIFPISVDDFPLYFFFFVSIQSFRIHSTLPCKISLICSRRGLYIYKYEGKSMCDIPCKICSRGREYYRPRIVYERTPISQPAPQSQHLPTE